MKQHQSGGTLFRKFQPAYIAVHDVVKV